MITDITTISGVVGATPATPLHPCHIEHLLTDSRSLTFPATTLFFALNTARRRGTDYIAQLYEQGVRNFVVDTAIAPLPADANVLHVPSALDALQQLGKWNREQHGATVVAITGSRGKTIVKEWLYTILRPYKRVTRSPRSYNSQIGVPLALWEINDRTEIAIIEAGISTVGEMERLEEMIQPDIAVITSITGEHDDGFSSRRQKADQKALLTRRARRVIYPADDATISAAVTYAAPATALMPWSLSDSPDAAVTAACSVGDSSTAISLKVGGESTDLTIPFTSRYDIENVITCLTTAQLLHIAPALLPADAIFKRVATRIDVLEGVNDSLLFFDNYTPDYRSLATALDFIARRATDHRSTTVITAVPSPEEMTLQEAFAAIAALVKARGVKRLIGIGKEWAEVTKSFDGIECFSFPTVADFLEKMPASNFADERILIKGGLDFLPIADALELQLHETMLEVNLDALASNYNFFRSRLRPSTGMICMVKASGYGAGSYEVAKTLQDSGAAYLAVAVIDEGVALRRAGITMPIMVLNPVVMNYKTLFAYNLEPEIFSIDMVRDIIAEAELRGITDYPVHVKIDTGMHRLGFLREQLPELIATLHEQRAIRPATVFSHLATADCFDKDDYTRHQLDYFDAACAELQAGFSHRIKRHILNTAGIIRFTEHQHDFVRLGIGLYGIPILHDGSEDGLRQVSTLSTEIISIKAWEAGTTIGYGRRGVLKRDSLIATIPIGYADGFNRHLGNGGTTVWVNGHLCPTVGNICMDVCMIDVTDADCRVGDRVEIFGDHIPAQAIADRLGTIPYEVLTSVAPRVKRVYYRE